MTTSPVMTVTDELLAEIEEAAKAATPGPWNYDGSYVCTMRQDGETFYVESWNPVADAPLSKNVKYISAANPATITALTAELRRLRAENAELAKDAARLQFVIDEEITISKMNGTGFPMVYQCQWHDCRQIDWYSSPVEAIDTAISRTRGEA